MSRLPTRQETILVWFRRDLRCEDHAALAAAADAAKKLHCVFVFDRAILDALDDHADRRVEFILESVRELHERLACHGGGLIVLHDEAVDAIPRLAAELGVDAVYVNRDYEPDAITRDAHVERALARAGIAWRSFKDQVIFEPHEVLTREAKPFSVFTPYTRAWLARLAPRDAVPHPIVLEGKLAGVSWPSMPDLAALGFLRTNLAMLPLPPGMSGARTLWDDFRRRLDRYRTLRDFPGRNGPSYLSVHLRFGTISIRELVRAAAGRQDEGSRTWLTELIWREFYFMILYHHPHVVTRAFRPEFDGLAFPGGEDRFAAWCEARTGYPIVDAGMRQLNATGYMHNRLRMITASFLVKDLHVDWRRGERYFARKLNDYDLAANNGGWQWAASTGCDAQPWFRIFNPVTQSRRFDPDGRFIRRYVPELVDVPAACIHAPWCMSEEAQHAAGVRIGTDYPRPLVDHAQARGITLELFGAGRTKQREPR